MRSEDLLQLLRHMEWADARVWRAVLALPAEAAASQPMLEERLLHIHVVQRAFLCMWRGEPPTDFPEPAQFAALADVARWARPHYAEAAALVGAADAATLARPVRAALDSGEPAERIVAEHAGELVGSVMLFPPASDAYAGAAGRANWPELRLLAVAPEARGLGVGRVLVEECVRRAHRAGAAELGLHTSASMRVAMRLYERMGFVRAPEYDFQPEGAEVVEAYRLPLGAAGLSTA